MASDGIRNPELTVFSRKGDFLALGNENGTVTVYELAEVQRRLGLVGLGWRHSSNEPSAAH